MLDPDLPYTADHPHAAERNSERWEIVRDCQRMAGLLGIQDFEAAVWQVYGKGTVDLLPSELADMQARLILKRQATHIGG